MGGVWQPYADMTGEVVTSLTTPPGVTSIATDRTGTQEWRWTATFEVFDAWPRADVDGGQVPDGTYRFVVDGHHRAGGATVPYRVTSDAFTVTPWEGLHAGDPVLRPDGSVAVLTDPVVYPRTYTPPASLRLVADDGGDDGTAAHRLFCRTCSFRPWARTGEVTAVTVSVVRDGVLVRTVAASPQGEEWVAPVDLRPGELAFVTRAGVRDGYGEINGLPTRAVDATGTLVAAPDLGPAAVVPELPWVPLAPLAAVLVAVAVLQVRRGARAE